MDFGLHHAVYIVERDCEHYYGAVIALGVLFGISVIIIIILVVLLLRPRS